MYVDAMSRWDHELHLAFAIIVSDDDNQILYRSRVLSAWREENLHQYTRQG